MSNAYHDQCRCASKIIIDLVTTLKELDRYEDSLIIIHGDHGSGRYVVIDDEPVDRSIGAYTDAFSFSRAHTLLLIKPPANGNTTKKFLVSDKETTLLDIAPTILDAVNLEIPERFEGESLLNPVDSKKTTRYYHFYRKIGARDMTDKMIRWIINQDHALRDEEIPIPLSSTPEN